MDSRKLDYGVLEYYTDSDTAAEGSTWFARVKVHDLTEAKKIIQDVKDAMGKNVKARIRGRGKWTDAKYNDYVFMCALNGSKKSYKLPYNIPIMLADYCIVYFY